LQASVSLGNLRQLVESFYVVFVEELFFLSVAEFLMLRYQLVLSDDEFFLSWFLCYFLPLS